MSVTIFNQLIVVDTFTFDNIDAFSVIPDISITEHPIELGTNVSDHAQVRNQTLSVVGRVTTTPLLVPRPGSFELAQAFFERNEGRLMTVVAPLGVFTNCMVQTYPRTATVLQELIFPVRLKQVRLASAISVPIPPRTPAPPLQVGAPTAQNVGTQPPLPTPPPASLLAAFTGAGL